MLEKSRVLLTGATGFVGSRVARRLLDAGATVSAVVRRSGADPSLLGPHYEETVGDFVDPSVAVKAAVGCDLVVHAAATAGPEMEPVRRVNVDGTRSMIAAARTAGASRYVQISTISVYDVAGLETVDETAPLKSAADPYGTTKAEGDRLVLEAMTAGLSAVVLRPGAILGVHPTSTWGVKVPSRVRDRQIKLLRDGGNTMPFVHVEDLVDAILLALTEERAAGGVYNVLERNSTWRRYTDEVRTWFGTAELDRVPDAEAAAMTYFTGAFAAKRLRDEMAWRPRRSFEDGMAEAAAYWRAAASAPK
jgi:nucleoside-diphosphate-sugar epimerase